MIARIRGNHLAIDRHDLESVEPDGAELPPVLSSGLNDLPPPDEDSCRVARLADRLRHETLRYGRSHPGLAPGLAAAVDECLSDLIDSLMPGPGSLPSRAAA